MTSPFGSESWPVNPTMPSGPPAGYVMPTTPANPSQSEPPMTAAEAEARRNQFYELLFQQIVKVVFGFFSRGNGTAANQFAGWVSTLLNSGSKINAGNIVGIISSTLLRAIPFGFITDETPNLLPLADFPDGSIAPNPWWTVDLTSSRTDDDDTGSAKLVFDGLPHALRSGTTPTDRIPVSAGQTYTVTMPVRHQGYTGTGEVIQLHVVPFTGEERGESVQVAGYAPTVPDADWPGVEMSGTYLVPEGVTSVQVRVYVTEGAASGTGWFDEGSIGPSGKFKIGWIEGLPEAIAAGVAQWQALVDTVFNAFTALGTTGNQLEDLAIALVNIPAKSIVSVLGAANGLGGDLLDVLNAMVGGAVGQSGTGATPAEAFNIFSMISAWANRGSQAKDVTDTRTNTAADSGLGVSENSNLLLSLASSWLTCTQSASVIGYDYIEKTMPLGVVSWIGYGTTGITAVYVHIWKVNVATGEQTPLHSSENLVSLLSGAGEAAPGKYIQYELPIPIELHISDLIGYEIVVVGGTHHVRGHIYDLPSHPTAPIVKHGATRNNTTDPTTPPSSIARGAVNWSDNAPWVGISVDTGSGGDHRDPVFTYLGSTPTELPIPPWADITIGVIIGDTGGGQLGGTWGFAGNPSEPAQFAVVVWLRGTHYTGDTVITFTPGPGGAGGVTPLINGGAGFDGEGTTMSIPGHELSVEGTRGGRGVRNVLLGAPKPVGRGATPLEYGGYEFKPGGDQNAYGGDGIAPGGGAMGGGWLNVVSSGGHGAPGGGWTVFLPGDNSAPPPPDTTPPTAPTLTVDSATFSTLTVTASGATD